MKNRFLVILIVLGIQQITAQFTRRDSLQGGLRIERTCYDVKRYDLNITINPDQKNIKGFNEVTFEVLTPTQKIQMDLFENMKVDSIVWNANKLKYTRDNDAVFIDFTEKLVSKSNHKLKFYYSGNPIIARNAPWDGGFVFSKDNAGKDFIAVAVQGTGASLWYPVKDSQSDEPDNGASIKVAVPNGLMNVSNGRFLGSQDLKNGYTRWDWEVKNPINNYTITVNIADYVHIQDKMPDLDLDYYVLRENEAKAREHFMEVKPMMECFQSKFGRYPFWEDGYKLVETPYLGMEHQSAVAYGNKYKKGYMGFDLSGTGVGMFFDYITIHETGHEWFGNSITSSDIADMWIHEGFTTYSETVFVECIKGYDIAMKYVNGQAKNVKNDKPIIGQYGVNNEGSGDMYFKGSLLLNTLRHIIGDDEKWWQLLYNYSETFKKQIITSDTVIDYFNKASGMNLTPVFRQYLYTNQVPTFVYNVKGDFLYYSWDNANEDFNMPIDIAFEGTKIRLNPTLKVQKIKLKKLNKKSFQIFDNQFYVKIKEGH
ncbi:MULTISPECIES: M1 family metallopeptidase [unclassified Flavobacterium]|uniref:M1 family metallopeptidase n=1 Tax=unclassified Flavobacterium TaxID=196869 RepID=UPI001292B052|nr:MULTISPECIES: M1 family metallopeptidase [unclassified Flavobacterium]MQP52861.1 M1 family peptidase [Flavobacterium sp. LMO9]MQP63135.1 M1 family peptidase [Flavobacterium sp. LMO6]